MNGTFYPERYKFSICDLLLDKTHLRTRIDNPIIFLILTAFQAEGVKNV